MNFYRFMFPVGIDNIYEETVELLESPPRIPAIDCPECGYPWPVKKIQIFDELKEDPFTEVPHFGAVRLDIMEKIYDKVRKIYNLSDNFELGPGTELGKYRYKLLTKKYTDFNWHGNYMCFTERARQAFINHQLTGWGCGEVIMENYLDDEPSPKMYQLIVTGKGGPAKIEKQPTINFECKLCGYIKYEEFESDYILVDETKWDGSDFFQFDLPNKGPDFVSERTKECFENEKLTNYGLYSLDSFKLKRFQKTMFIEKK